MGGGSPIGGFVQNGPGGGRYSADEWFGNGRLLSGMAGQAPNLPPGGGGGAGLPAPEAEAGLEEDPTDILKAALAGQAKGAGMPEREQYSHPGRTPLSELINKRPSNRFDGAVSMAPGGRPGGL